MWNPTITKSLWLLSRSEHSSSVGFEQFEWQEYAINLCARFLLFRKYKNCYQWLTCIMPKLLQIQTQTPALSIMFAFSWHLPSLSSKQQNIKVQPNHKAIGNECVLTNTDLLWLLSRCAYSGNFGFWAIWVTRVVPSISVWFCGPVVWKLLAMTYMSPCLSYFGYTSQIPWLSIMLPFSLDLSPELVF